MIREADILKLTAKISNPWGDDSLPDLENETVRDVVSVIRRNGVSLLLLNQRYGDAVSKSPFQAYLQEENAVFRRLREEFERVRTAFEEEGIRTVLIKSTGLYPSFPHLSSNLDVLVPHERGDAARRILRKLGYVELLNVEEPNKFLFRRFVWSQPSFTFHLHGQVGWGVPFIDTDLVWENMRSALDDPDIRIPGPVEALLITLAHWFYEDKALSLGNLFLTANALRDLNCALEQAASGASVRGWEDGYFAALNVFSESWRRIFDVDFFDRETEAFIEKHLHGKRFLGSFLLAKVRYIEEQPARIPFEANKIVYYRKILADKKRPAYLKTKDVFATLLWAFQLKARVRSQKPLLIGISGCDGSGKTLQAEHLKEAFHTCDLRTRIIWWRGSSSRFMSFFINAGKRIFPRRRGGGLLSQDSKNVNSITPTQEERVLSQRAYLRNPFIRFLYSVLYSIDLAAVYCLKARLYLLTGNIVICDRYTIDARVDFAISSGGSAGKIPLSLRTLEAFAPKPRLSYVLDVEEAEALERKPDEGDIAHLAEARRMFLDIAKERGMTVIPSDLSREAVHEKIVLESLSAYYKRHRTILNAMLFKNPQQMNPGRWRE